MKDHKRVGGIAKSDKLLDFIKVITHPKQRCRTHEKFLPNL